jgi:hypothetical protein
MPIAQVRDDGQHGLWCVVGIKLAGDFSAAGSVLRRAKLLRVMPQANRQHYDQDGRQEPRNAALARGPDCRGRAVVTRRCVKPVGFAGSSIHGALRHRMSGIW